MTALLKSREVQKWDAGVVGPILPQGSNTVTKTEKERDPKISGQKGNGSRWIPPYFLHQLRLNWILIHTKSSNFKSFFF